MHVVSTEDEPVHPALRGLSWSFLDPIQGEPAPTSEPDEGLEILLGYLDEKHPDTDGKLYPRPISIMIISANKFYPQIPTVCLCSLSETDPTVHWEWDHLELKITSPLYRLSTSLIWFQPSSLFLLLLRLPLNKALIKV